MTPIALFVYNRPEHTKQTINALLNNKGVENYPLFVFADNARAASDVAKVAEVRDYCQTVSGFLSVTIIERDNNFGLARNIISGVSQLFNDFEEVIVLEDDLVTSTGFLDYMKNALTFYKNKAVFSITGYAPPISIPTNYHFSTYYAYRNGAWGWATWRNRWQSVDWEVAGFNNFIRSSLARQLFSKGGVDLPIMLLKQQLGVINSWSIRFCYASFEQSLPTVYPVQSLVVNVGADGSGTHMNSSSKYLVEATENINNEAFVPENVFSEFIQRGFRRFYQPSLYRRMINRMKILWYIFKTT